MTAYPRPTAHCANPTVADREDQTGRPVHHPCTEQRREDETRTTTRSFFTMTKGRAGSFWLANALDLHPDIHCSHGQSAIAAQDAFFNGTNGIYAVGTRAAEKLRDGWSAPVLAYDYQQATKAARILPGGLYEENNRTLRRNANGTTYAGNVHGVWFGENFVEMSGYGPASLSVLFRHPLKVIHSAWSRYEINGFGYGNPASVKHLEATKKLEAYGAKKSLVDYFCMDFLEREIHFYYYEMMSPYPKYPFELLVKDRDYFAEAVPKIVGGDLPVSARYLEAVANIGVLNRHAHASLSHERIWALLPVWFHTALEKLFFSSPRIRRQFDSWGYWCP